MASKRPEPQRPDSDGSRLPAAFGAFLIGFGAAAALSAAATLGPVLALWHSQSPAELADVRASYAVAAVGCGIALASLGFLARRKQSLTIAKVGLTVAVLSAILLADRFLLLQHGLPLWAADPEAHFVNRPSKYGLWPNGREIRTNRWGHHDDEFPEKPPPGERRILALGDSVTFGHMVTREEAYPNQLERILAERDPSQRVQVINAGVQGYSTAQELILMERSLRFEPDTVLIGVCLNDFTEPFTVDADLGGTGLDYHLVRNTGNALLSYLLHETGFGRAALQSQWEDTTQELEALREAHGVESFALRPPGDPAVARNYELVLGALDRIYDLAEAEGMRVLVLMFPYTFQFAADAPLHPQKAVVEQARARGVPVVDFRELLAPRLKPGEENRYFQDASHFTPYGHQVAAYAIADALAQMNATEPSAR